VPTTAQKMKEMRARLGLSMAEMARLVGFATASGWQRYEDEENYKKHRYIRGDLMNTLLQRVVAKGDPIVSADEVYSLGGISRGSSEKKVVAIPRKAGKLAGDGPVKIEEIDIRAGLGGGGLTESESDGWGPTAMKSRDIVKAEWSFPRSYLSEINVKNQGLYLFRAVGDSMTRPDGSGIQSGDLLLADTEDTHPSPPGIFAIWDGFGTVVKRLEFVMNSAPARLKIKSDNPAHESYERTEDEVKIIGRCVWYGRRL